MKFPRFLAFVGAGILKSLFLTLRLRVEDPNGFVKSASSAPAIFCFWHNRILGITFVFRRIYPKHRKGVTVLTSASKDGEILANIVAAFGMGSARGSSSRRGSRALLELVRLIRGGTDIAITPDGPRGPRYSLGPGVIQLAQSTGTQILPVHASFSRCVRLKTWDGFIIPLPFSTVSVTVGSPISIPAQIDGEGFENERKKLEDILKYGAD
jgi:hypothetical protein